MLRCPICGDDLHVNKDEETGRDVGDWCWNCGFYTVDAEIGPPSTKLAMDIIIEQKTELAKLRAVVEAAEEYKNAAEVYMMMSTTSSSCSCRGSMCSKEQRLFAMLDEI